MKRTIRHLSILLAIALIISVYACKSKTETYVSDEGTVTVDSEGKKADITIKTKDGETYTMNVNKGTLPDGWPSDVPVISGGSILFSQSNASGKMQQISIETTQSIEDALDYYRKTLTSGQWNIQNTMSMQNMKMFNAAKDSKELMLQAVRDGSKTQIQIIINDKPS